MIYIPFGDKKFRFSNVFMAELVVSGLASNSEIRSVNGRALS
jgi:hypothetical protein